MTTKTTATTATSNADLQKAYDGSYYTILGAGGSLDDWINGYEDLKEKAGIGKPTKWIQTTGGAINDYAKPTRSHDAFHYGLVVLMFPLDGLNTGKLAIFKMQMEDRWFDDIVDNIRH